MEKKKSYGITGFCTSCPFHIIRLGFEFTLPLAKRLWKQKSLISILRRRRDHFRDNLEHGAKEREGMKQGFYPHRMGPSYTP